MEENKNGRILYVVNLEDKVEEITLTEGMIEGKEPVSESLFLSKDLTEDEDGRINLYSRVLVPSVDREETYVFSYFARDTYAFIDVRKAIEFATKKKESDLRKIKEIFKDSSIEEEYSKYIGLNLIDKIKNEEPNEVKEINKGLHVVIFDVRNLTKAEHHELTKGYSFIAFVEYHRSAWDSSFKAYYFNNEEYFEELKESWVKVGNVRANY